MRLSIPAGGVAPQLANRARGEQGVHALDWEIIT